MGLGSSSLPTDMSGPTAQFVKDAITQDKIVIFSKSYCPYCKMAKDVIYFYCYIHEISINLIF